MAEQPLKSPLGDSVLVPVTVAEVQFYKDPASGGYWLPAAALHDLTERQETPVAEVHTGEIMQVHQGRFCPQDGAALMEFEYEEHSGIKMDYCPQCQGIWLDAGELPRLLNYLSEYEFSDHLRTEGDEDEHVGLTDRVLLFLYQLTRRPPLY